MRHRPVPAMAMVVAVAVVVAFRATAGTCGGLAAGGRGTSRRAARVVKAGPWAGRVPSLATGPLTG